MKRLELFQDALVESGLVDRDQVTLQHFNLIPSVEEDDKDSLRYIIQRDVFIHIREFVGDIDLLALVAKLAVNKLWPSPCQAAELKSIEPDPLDSDESVIVMMLLCNDVYHLKAVSEGEDTGSNVVIENEGVNYQMIDEIPLPLSDLPSFARLKGL